MVIYDRAFLFRINCGLREGRTICPWHDSIGLGVLDDIVELFLILRQYPQQGAIVSDNIEA